MWIEDLILILEHLIRKKKVPQKEVFLHPFMWDLIVMRAHEEEFWHPIDLLISLKKFQKIIHKIADQMWNNIW